MTINENSDSQHDSNTLDIEKLREQIKLKYREVATTPDMEFHFHTGRKLAEKLGYSPQVIDEVCATGVESFAGVGNPFSLRTITKGEKVVDVGSGAGFDSFVAASLVGDSGEVIGVDMTEEMLVKASSSAKEMSLDTVNFKEGIIEDLPITDGWADAVISNGVINLCADKRAAFSEIFRILKPGGYLQFADIANSNPIPQAVIENIDLWTAWIAGGLPCAGWEKILRESGFQDIKIGDAVDTFGGASGEANAKQFGVYGYAFLARKPDK